MSSPGSVTTKSPKKSALRDVIAVGRALSEEYHKRGLGNRSDPIEELVYIALTRQTHSKNANRSWQAVVSAGGPEALLEMSTDTLADRIKDGGFSRQKATRIRSSLRRLKETMGELSLRRASTGTDQELELSWPRDRAVSVPMR